MGSAVFTAGLASSLVWGDAGYDYAYRYLYPYADACLVGMSRYVHAAVSVGVDFYDCRMGFYRARRGDHVWVTVTFFEDVNRVMVTAVVLVR